MPIFSDEKSPLPLNDYGENRWSAASFTEEKPYTRRQILINALANIGKQKEPGQRYVFPIDSSLQIPERDERAASWVIWAAHKVFTEPIGVVGNHSFCILDVVDVRIKRSKFQVSPDRENYYEVDGFIYEMCRTLQEYSDNIFWYSSNKQLNGKETED